MAFPIVGRKVGIYDASSSPHVLVAGVNSKSISINNEPIDITNDDDSGFRTLLSDPGTRSIDLSVEGVTKNTTWLTAATASTPALLKSYTIVFDTSLGTLSGDFYLSNVTLGAPTADKVSFSATLTSSGAFTFV